MRRPSWLTVAPVVVVGVLIVSVVLGRDHGKASPPAKPATSAPATTAPSAPPPAPTTLTRGKAVGVGGGSTTGPGGVSLGYPRTPEGAVSAATNYATTRDLPGISDPELATAVAEAISAPGFAPETRFVLTVARDDKYQSTVHPNWGAYAVLSYNANGAVVAMWWPTVYSPTASYTPDPEGKPDPRLGAHWQLKVYRVVWAEGDWKWPSFDRREGASENLQPTNPDVQPSVQEKFDILHRTNPRPAINKIGYQSWNWLEYADA